MTAIALYTYGLGPPVPGNDCLRALRHVARVRAVTLGPGALFHDDAFADCLRQIRWYIVVDMQLICDFLDRSLSLEDGIEDTLKLLRLIEQAGLYQPVWWGPEWYALWADETAFRMAVAQQNTSQAAGLDGHYQLSIGAGAYDPNGVSQLTLSRHWSDAEKPVLLPNLSMSVNKPHAELGTDFSYFETLLDVVLSWRTPLHITWAWPHYRQQLQPLGSARRGVGWMGWLPFEIAPEDVPEAEIVRPKGSGTFVAAQRNFWFSNGAQADVSAIGRAQALDMSLNRLGVCPLQRNCAAEHGHRVEGAFLVRDWALEPLKATQKDG